MNATKSCFLFLGPELGEKQAALNELRKTITNKSGAGKIPPEETVYYAGETPVSVIVSGLLNRSLFADSRLFLVKNAENLKKKEEVDLLVSCLESLQDNTTLVLISEENNISKSLEKAVPASAKRVFYELSDQKKTEWVRDFFRRHNCSLNNDAVMTVLELVENNTEALQYECSRLVMFLEKDREIGPEEVDRWLSHTREESAFTLFSRIAAGDFSRSLESLRVLLAAKIDPVAVLSGLLWCFRKLRDFLALKESGVTDEWEFKKIGISAPQAWRDYSGAARFYDSFCVQTLISLTAEYDLKIRQAGTFPKYILLDEYLYKIHFSAVIPGIKQ